MGKNVAVSIGIKRTGRLQELPGAVTGAKEFGDWAEGQGYETHLVTDKTGDVTVKTLKTLIKSIVDEGETERLIVYLPVTGSSPWPTRLIGFCPAGKMTATKLSTSTYPNKMQSVRE